jgi:hypothetical protein
MNGEVIDEGVGDGDDDVDRCRVLHDPSYGRDGFPLVDFPSRFLPEARFLILYFGRGGFFVRLNSDPITQGKSA